MAGKVRIAVTGGPIKGSEFVYGEHDTLLFGRAPDCHARLSEEDRTWPAPEDESTLYVTRPGRIWCDRAMFPAQGSTLSGAGGLNVDPNKAL